MTGVDDFADIPGTQTHQPPADRAIAQVAASQYGVIALHQLGELGLSARAARGRVRAGRLHRVHRGVYAVGHRVLSREGRWMAAVLACGPDAALSHRSAAGHLGLRQDNRSLIDVITPRAGLRRKDRIDRHRSDTLRAVDVVVVRGIPCTSVARTLLDLAEVVDRGGLRRACNQAEVLRLFDGRALEDVLARADGRRGAKALREVLAHGRLGEAITRNDLEERFLTLCEAAGLPPPRVNAWIHLDGGGAEADFFWPEHSLIAETDGGGVHNTPSAFQADRRRDQHLLRKGYRVVRFTWWQVFHEENEVIETLRMFGDTGRHGAVRTLGPRALRGVEQG